MNSILKRSIFCKGGHNEIIAQSRPRKPSAQNINYIPPEDNKYTLTAMQPIKKLVNLDLGEDFIVGMLVECFPCTSKGQLEDMAFCKLAEKINDFKINMNKGEIN